MTINQISIFIENRSGTLIKVLEVLKQSGIQIIASTIADTAEYGIYRLICSEPMRAYEELKKANIAVALSDVFAIELDNQPMPLKHSRRLASASLTCIPSCSTVRVFSSSVPTTRNSLARLSSRTA